MANYTNLKNNLWEQVEKRLDKYAKFYWDDEPMINYHAFIINETKGSLKFYNGPSFSNSYTKPQFESASSRLTGVTFNTQQISFTIAIYAVTEEMYRKLIYKLSPYTIANLSFDFDKKWRYIVKLAKISDSTRYIVGHDSDGQDLYYTELQLTFEVQGDAVAHGVEEISYNISYPSASKSIINFTQSSDLDTPFLLTFRVHPEANQSEKIITCTVNNKYATNLELFNISLVNLNNSTYYTFEYNSQTGDLCLVEGNTRKIITLLTTYSSGRRIVNALNTKSCFLPGTFNDQNWEELSLSINSIGCTVDLDSINGNGINCYPRTTLI